MDGVMFILNTLGVTLQAVQDENQALRKQITDLHAQVDDLVHLADNAPDTPA